ncbi:MAG: hypothetical protein DRI75_09625 [Bacteroidetes bacterium]|nr:MAG: hypothetical protein DRI75_09625 [Bacteroidota bacterium]
MKIMKNFVLVLLLISSLKTVAQDSSDIVPETSSSSFDLGVDIQSRYIWRGIQLGGNSSSVQPWAEFSSGAFSIGAWGAYNLGGTSIGNEADLYISLAISDALSFTVTDYFFPTDGNFQGYFPYNAGHVFEGMLSFAGTEGFPIGISVATNFGGAIKYDDTSDEKSAYSTYVEASYSTTAGDVELGLFAGAVFADDNGYYLTDGSGLINVGFSASKEIKLSESFSLPVNAALILNPDAENIYLTFGFSL